MAKSKKIGQGINALISPDSTVDMKQNEILISKISPNPNQPRKIFEDKSLQQLAQSIKEKGLITPITVKKEGNKYIIIAGERRFRAHQLLKKKKIPAYIIESDSSRDLMYMALIENIQREDLNAIEQAKAYQHLKDNLGISITEIAKTIGKSRPAVSNTLRLLQLPIEIQNSILAGEINEGQARVILQKNTTQARIALWKRILREKIDLGLDIGSYDVLAEFSNETKPRNFSFSVGSDLLKSALSFKKARNDIFKILNKSNFAKDIVFDVANKGFRF